jgi:hypothetical protein
VVARAVAQQDTDLVPLGCEEELAALSTGLLRQARFQPSAVQISWGLLGDFFSEALEFSGCNVGTKRCAPVSPYAIALIPKKSEERSRVDAICSYQRREEFCHNRLHTQCSQVAKTTKRTLCLGWKRNCGGEKSVSV